MIVSLNNTSATSTVPERFHLFLFSNISEYQDKYVHTYFSVRFLILNQCVSTTSIASMKNTRSKNISFVMGQYYFSSTIKAVFWHQRTAVQQWLFPTQGFHTLSLSRSQWFCWFGVFKMDNTVEKETRETCYEKRKMTARVWVVSFEASLSWITFCSKLWDVEAQSLF